MSCTHNCNQGRTCTCRDDESDDWVPMRPGDWEELIWLLIIAIGGSCILGWAGWAVITKVML